MRRCLASRRGFLTVADDADEIVKVIEGDFEAFEDVGAGFGLVFADCVRR